MTRADRIVALHAAARERILVLDGAWGAMIQRSELSEEDFRGDRFTGHVGQMKGNNDILCITRPDVISGLHDQYFAAGADISETNTFSATVIAQDDGAQCRITVEDDGAGSDPERIRQVLAGTADGDSIGMANVDARLRAVYGDDHGLLIETAVGAGTKVTVRVPKWHAGVRAS